MITSKHASVLVGLAALLGLAASEGCSSDNSAGTPTAGAGPAAAGTPGTATAGASAGGAGGIAAGGAAAGGAGVGGAGVAGAGVGGASAGAGGATAGAAGVAGGSAGAGGVSGGAGGASGGAGGATGGAAGAGGGSAGGTAVTFSQVATILGTSCAGNSCHGGGMQLNYTNMTGLYTRLTTPIAGPVPHCVGTTLVVPGNAAGSFLVSVLKASSSCKNNNGTEMVGPMPLGCPGARACLTAAQMKTISDWVSAGAPQ